MEKPLGRRGLDQKKKRALRQKRPKAAVDGSKKTGKLNRNPAVAGSRKRGGKRRQQHAVVDGNPVLNHQNAVGKKSPRGASDSDAGGKGKNLIPVDRLGWQKRMASFPLSGGVISRFLGNQSFFEN